MLGSGQWLVSPVLQQCGAGLTGLTICLTIRSSPALCVRSQPPCTSQPAISLHPACGPSRQRRCTTTLLPHWRASKPLPLFVHTSFVLRFFPRPRCPQLYHHPCSRPAPPVWSYFLCPASIHSPVTAQPCSPPDWNAAAAHPYLTAPQHNLKMCAIALRPRNDPPPSCIPPVPTPFLCNHAPPTPHRPSPPPSHLRVPSHEHSTPI